MYEGSSEKGFSLIELVFAVSILSILAAIAIPAFRCILQRAKAESALASLRLVQKQCNIQSLLEAAGDVIISKIPGYSFSPQVANPCLSEIKELAFISDDENVLPSYIYTALTRVISYRFAGKTSYDLSSSAQQVCAATPFESAKIEESKYFSKPCRYVEKENYPINFSRINYARCEEKRRGVALCWDWSKELGNPKPCTDLCAEWIQRTAPDWYDRHCVKKRYGLPDWITKGTDAQMQYMGYKNADDYVKFLIENGNAQR